MQRNTCGSADSGRDGIDVACERLSSGGNQRVNLGLTARQVEKRWRPTGPFDLIKAQCRRSAAAHPMDCRRQQDRLITDVSRLVGLGID